MPSGDHVDRKQFIEVADDEDWLESDEEMIPTLKQNDYDMASKDTLKVQSKMFDEGYRAGIGKGKEAMIQVGFDQGYNEKGALTGKKYGNLMGAITALEQYMGKNRIEDSNGMLALLKRSTANLKLSDLVEPDWEALEHEREHGADISQIKKETEEQRLARQNILDELQTKADRLIKDILPR